MLISLFGSACGSILQYLSPNLTYLIIFRFISGLFGTSVVSCQSYIVDCIKDDEKSKYLSQIMGFSTIATAIGPLISGELYSIKSHLPFLMSGILYGLCFVLILILLNESPKFDETRERRSSIDILLHKNELTDINIINENNDRNNVNKTERISLSIVYYFCLLIINSIW